MTCLDGRAELDFPLFRFVHVICLVRLLSGLCRLTSLRRLDCVVRAEPSGLSPLSGLSG